jgi:SAM-dependent methyltransferase
MVIRLRRKNEQEPTGLRVQLAKGAMKIWPNTPDPEDPTKRERFNLREFTEGSPEERHRMMLETAESHFQHERELPLHTWFGFDRERMRSLLRGKSVLDLGCFVGGTTASHADAYDIAVMYGVDIDETLLDAARLFTAEGKRRCEFIKGFAEENPLPDEAVDAVLTQDTLEHVADIRATLSECFRVLRPSGLMFCVFPTFYHPWGNHLNLITNVPWLHAVFSDSTLRSAYLELLAERGEEAYWYRCGNDLEVNRRRFYSVNGTSVWAFRKVAQDNGFIIVHKNVVPLLGLGRRLSRHPTLRRISVSLRLLASLPILEEGLLHRAVYILQKPPRTWE